MSEGACISVKGNFEQKSLLYKESETWTERHGPHTLSLELRQELRQEMDFYAQIINKI